MVAGLMYLYWSKAAPGSYYLRTVPGGKGPAVGRLWRADMGIASGTFYHGLYDTPDAFISFIERGRPDTIIRVMERHIAARFPEATFAYENFPAPPGLWNTPPT